MTTRMSLAPAAPGARLLGFGSWQPENVVTNDDLAQRVDTGAEALRRLVSQVTRPVRWDACMAMLGDLGVTAVIELPPAGALVGLVKRELRGTATLALKTPDDLEKAAVLIKEHP